MRPQELTRALPGIGSRSHMRSQAPLANHTWPWGASGEQPFWSIIVTESSSGRSPCSLRNR
eukprot:1137157-Pelagomonas_calceolata.AAC.5